MHTQVIVKCTLGVLAILLAAVIATHAVSIFEKAGTDARVEFFGSVLLASPGPSSSPENARVLRGGSWNYHVATYFRCSNRSRNFPSGKNSGLGFRCATLLDSR